MTSTQTVAADLVRAIEKFSDAAAMSDQSHEISYKRLGQFVSSLNNHLKKPQVIGIFGSPGIAMAASAVACVINGRPFVHLDPAMPQMVLHNIISELQVSLIITCQTAASGHLPGDCVTIDATALLKDSSASYEPLQAASVVPEVATT